ncbi:hypothetical protein PAHAL_5G154400 [Panicum hallii]|uniref:Uncharacterized protein n=1 Tax=Panicum hallii TaxID=206008 RepID=A0A2S3HRL8_9POAL|nr:hypothetical protein PAHAL_5G154400 [Panicum hallii]
MDGALRPPRRRPLPAQHLHQRRAGADPPLRGRAAAARLLLHGVLQLLLHQPSRALLLLRRLHLGAADRARGARREPRVDAGDVEHVGAGGQRPHDLPFLHGAEADGALGAGARLARLPVHRGRQRRDGRGVQPALRGRGRRRRRQHGRRAAPVPAADVADVEVQEEGEAEHGHESRDGRGDEPHVVGPHPRRRGPGAAAEPRGPRVARLHRRRRRHGRWLLRDRHGVRALLLATPRRVADSRVGAKFVLLGWW